MSRANYLANDEEVINFSANNSHFMPSLEIYWNSDASQEVKESIMSDDEINV